MDRPMREEIAAHLQLAGYSQAHIGIGVRYADTCNATSVRDGFILAVSRLTFTDEDLASGALYTAPTPPLGVAS